jgi:hypothetical protein
MLKSDSRAVLHALCENLAEQLQAKKCDQRQLAPHKDQTE